jgi:hypothetical protein
MVCRESFGRTQCTQLKSLWRWLRGRSAQCAHLGWPGSRQRPDGSVLNWKSLPLKKDEHGILPFFIEWGESTVHPSLDSPKGCGIDSLQITTPDPASLAALRKTLDLDIAIGQSKTPRLVAHLHGPAGSLTLQSR